MEEATETIQISGVIVTPVTAADFIDGDGTWWLLGQPVIGQRAMAADEYAGELLTGVIAGVQEWPITGGARAVMLNTESSSISTVLVAVPDRGTRWSGDAVLVGIITQKE